MITQNALFYQCVILARGRERENKPNIPRGKCLAGQVKRKQAEHTPREMFGGAGKEKANRPYPAGNVWWGRERENKPNIPRGKCLAGQVKRKQAEHTPREMIDGAGNKKNKIKNIIKEKEKHYG